MHGLRLKIRLGSDTSDHLCPIAGVNGCVLIAVKNNRWLCRNGGTAIFIVSSSAHRGEGGGHIVRRPARKTRVHANGSIEVRINLSHSRCGGASRR